MKFVLDASVAVRVVLPNALTPRAARLRDEFKSNVGTSFKLLVRGKKGERTLTLTLADQV